MLDRQLVRKDPEYVRVAAKRKGVEAPVDDFLETDAKWRAVKHALDVKNAEMNQVSKSIGGLMKDGKKEEAEAAKAQAGTLKSDIQALEEEERTLEAQLNDIELQFPNLPHESVPDGVNENDNVVTRTYGDKPTGKTFVPHWDIAERLGLIDFERATKISGSGFALYTGQGARLVRALINFMLDQQSERGYDEIWPPALVLASSLVGTGNLPKFEEDLYKSRDDLYLIPTAEVPVTNIHAGEILDGTALPVKYAAYTPCFRREAGAAGRDTRGILRMHQFDKVELVKLVLPETSYDELETLVEDAEVILQALGLHYRVLLLCAGDMGEKGCKCYDLEVFAPGVDRYLEVSSCTNFEAYQARRASIRFRREAGAAPEPVHILNGSGLAVPRLMAALLETYYDAEQNVVHLPEILHTYFGGTTLQKPE